MKVQCSLPSVALSCGYRPISETTTTVTSSSIVPLSPGRRPIARNSLFKPAKSSSKCRDWMLLDEWVSQPQSKCPLNAIIAHRANLCSNNPKMSDRPPEKSPPPMSNPPASDATRASCSSAVTANAPIRAARPRPAPDANACAQAKA